VALMVLAIMFLYGGLGGAGLFSLQPIYDPKTFDWTKIRTATSFAALTYIGFDGVTTLAEDVENPKRNVLLAVVLTCIFAGVCSGVEAYLGARVWPDWRSFPEETTAFMDICRRVGGVLLFNAMGGILIVAAFGSGLTGTLGAARLLFGMGRDGVLPRKFFGYLKPGSSTPTYNIVLIGALAFAGAELLYHIGNAYEHAGELLNFGAFLAFTGVNLACFWQFTVLAQRKGVKWRLVQDAVLPLVGFLVCGYIWWNLNHLAKTVGGIWFAIGILYVGYKTNWFRSAPVMIDFSDN
jgi:putrescine importer